MASGSSARDLDGGEGYVPLGTTRLFYRDLGHGLPIVVLHGGPDFNHNYLLPEMDRLADSFRLIYYDQRGRGRSADGVKPEDVTITSEVEDLEALRTYLGLERTALLGHSWGGLLAMEYAVNHPDRVSHLILMNSGPGSYRDRLLFSQHLLSLRSPDDIERMRQLSETAEFQQGNLAVEAEYYRIHFRVAGSQPEQVEQVVERLRTHFNDQTTLTARRIEHRLYEQTWLKDDYDLLPPLGGHGIRALVIHGDKDFVPVEVASHIADAIPGAQLTVLADSGHFSYMDHPDTVRELITAFLQPSNHQP